MKKIVLASNNKHKCEELSQIFGSQWSIAPAQSVAPGVRWDETGSTFLENARIKIAALRPFTQEFILADDSGLCVDALNGAPGIYSSSFGGIEGDYARNNSYLLDILKDVPAEERGAHFICTLVLQDWEGTEIIAEGRCFGAIGTQLKGKQGFGYDALFYLPEHKCTMAELTEEQKNKMSHRGRALRDLLRKLS